MARNFAERPDDGRTSLRRRDEISALDSAANERWLPIPGFEGLYEVSDLGRARSVDRIVPYRDGRRVARFKGRLLSQAPDEKGYLRAVLCKAGRQGTYRVASLVLLAFVGPRPAGYEARHLGGIKSDNSVGNLAWGTPQENADDKFLHGVAQAQVLKTRGTLNGRAKLTEEMVVAIREATGWQYDIARRFGVSPQTVSAIKNGTVWSWL